MALTREERQNIRSEYALNTNDTGSSQLQIALLTKNITFLTEHCQKHPKDFSSRRGLLRMVCNRRSLLQYIQRKDANKYKELIAKLGLRK